MKTLKMLPPIAAISVALFAALSSFGDPIYVSTFDELKNAVDNAQGGEEIVMAKTTFVQTSGLTVKQAITLRGAGENWETVIDGNKAQNMSVSAAGAKLYNFTITNMGGQWAGAAGLSLSGNSIVSNVVVRQIGNKWVGASDGTRFPLTVSAGLVTHCWITNNVMPNNAGVNLKGANAVIENCYFADNVDRGCAGNASYRGIVVVSAGTLRNCTIVNNTSGYGGLYYTSANGKIYNNIIWGNKGDSGTLNWLFSGNHAQGNWKGNCTTPLCGTEANGNIDSDPLLMSDNLHFMKTSPCNGTAKADLAPAYDIKGNVRGETPSMGCLEYEKPEGFAVTIVALAESVELPQTIDLTTAIDGDAAEPIHYAWDFDGDGEIDSEEPQPTLDEPGKYHVSLTMTDFNGKTASAAYGPELIVAPKGGFVIYVSPTGDGTDPYGGFATGFSSIPDAIAFASPGDNIELDRTTFALQSGIVVDKKVTLRGAGENWETVLDGQDKGRPIRVKAAGALLHSFTFMRIGSEYSSENGLILENDAVVSNVVARGNGNGMTKSTGNGTRFVWTVSAGLVTHCWSTNNIAPCNAGVAMTGGTIENSYFADNVDSGYGTKPEYWGIFRLNGGTVRNCTIVNNKSPLGAIYYASGNLYNNIIWGNTPNGSSEVNNWMLNGTPSMNNWKGNCTMPLAGTEANGNIAEDPLLLDDNLHFFKNSPCNGTAVVPLAAATDLDGNVRGDQPSMGAVEYLAGALACTISASSTTADQPAKIVLKCEIDGDVTGEVTYDWDLTGDGSLPVVHGAEVELSGIGLYRPSVKVFVDGQLKATATSQAALTVYDEGGAVYVTSGENPNAKPPYATWATAATNMVDAYDYAQAGKEMLLDAGTHFLSGVFEVGRAVKIRAVEGPEKTFLANPNSSPTKAVGHIVLLKANGCLLEGVTIRDQNFVNNNGNGAMLGVIYGTLRNCRFLGNRSSGHGGVSTDGGANAVIENCVFRGNVTPVGATQGPTCVRLSGSKSILRNCLFEDNTNTVTSANDASYRGCAVLVLEQNALIANCTFVGNITSNGFNSVVNNQTMNGTFCMANVKNCVSTGNFKTVDGVVVPSNELGENASGGLCTKVSNSLVYPTDADYSGFTKVLTVDPQFVDAANGDYRLTVTSPAVNGGDNLDYTAESIDLDGKARIYKFGLKSSKADMGCYESPYGQPGLSILVR